MSDDKSLPGGQEKIVRAVERVLAASARAQQPGVKITNLASGVVQVEVHDYDDDVSVAGERARVEFERQTHLVGVPAAELERLRWLASIGQAAMDRGMVFPPDAETQAIQADEQASVAAGDWDAAAAPARTRKSVPATGNGVDDELLDKLTEINRAAGMEVSDA